MSHVLHFILSQPHHWHHWRATAERGSDRQTSSCPVAARSSSADPMDDWLPDQADVDALRELLDLMVNFPSNDQRARYLLSCNWMRDRDQRIRGEADKA